MPFVLNKISTNVQLERTTAMPTPTAPTPKDPSTVRAKRDTLEMESRVLVSCIYITWTSYKHN